VVPFDRLCMVSY